MRTWDVSYSFTGYRRADGAKFTYSGSAIPASTHTVFAVTCMRSGSLDNSEEGRYVGSCAVLSITLPALALRRNFAIHTSGGIIKVRRVETTVNLEFELDSAVVPITASHTLYGISRRCVVPFEWVLISSVLGAQVLLRGVGKWPARRTVCIPVEYSTSISDHQPIYEGGCGQ